MPGKFHPINRDSTRLRGKRFSRHNFGETHVLAADAKRTCIRGIVTPGDTARKLRVAVDSSQYGSGDRSQDAGSGG